MFSWEPFCYFPVDTKVLSAMDEEKTFFTKKSPIFHKLTSEITRGITPVLLHLAGSLGYPFLPEVNKSNFLLKSSKLWVATRNQSELT